MGLDMSLVVKRTFLNDSEWDAQVTNDYNKIINIVDRNNLMSNSEYPVMRVELEVLHWRRFYALHFWFIANGIKSDLSEREHRYYISRVKLELLVDILDQIVDDNDKAYDLLPSDDYDEQYYKLVTHSRDVLRELLAGIKTEQFLDVSWNVYYVMSY
jgi:hypothetical protein